MKNTLAWITWFSLSAASPFAVAVELGSASVSSYLNAPLDASIPLLESSDYALDNIRIGIAESSDFATANLEWTPLAASVRAQVVEYQGQRQVRLSSDQAMREPWLDLLLTVDFPGGQQFRDITLLFDPPSYSQGSSQDVSQSQTRNASPAASAEAPSVTTPQAVRNTQAQANEGSQNSAYVSSGDTLWGVAERVKPPEASVQQTMIALLEANPAAFPAGNIHAMRAGQTLRVPGAERILARSHSDADTAIQAMNEAWQARRNGPLQAVPLTEVETAPVSDPAIAAAQILQADETQANNALAAGGSESVVPDSVVPELEESASGDQAAVGEQADQAEALTRAELTEQLRLSQATFQQVLEERELMRAELSELRGEVTSLTESLSDALVAQAQLPEPFAARMQENDGPSVSAFIARYQLPLALVAIALLVALLIWLRKRREETWEDVSFAEPVINPTTASGATPGAAPKVEPKAEPMPEAVPVTYPTHPNADAVDEPQNDSGQPAVPNNEPEPRAETDALTTNDELPIDTDQWLVDDQGNTPAQDDTLRYENSQAAGLAEQGRQRRLGLHVVAVDPAAKVSLAPPPSAEPISQLMASIGTDFPAPEPAASEHVQQAEQPSDAAEDPGHRFIDYHPPILNSASSISSNGALNSQDGSRIETPMQPTVEFASEPHAEPAPPAKHPRRPIEEEWEIEEVAFKPRGLDNGDPSKSSK